MTRMKGKYLAWMGFMIVFLGWISWVEAARTTINIAKADDSAPGTGTSGKFASFGPFSLDDAGHVAFEAAITGSTNNQGLFLATKTPGVDYQPLDSKGNPKHLQKIVLDGDTAPGAGSFFSFDTLSVNTNQTTNKTQVAFWASVLRRDGITIDEGVYLYTKETSMGSLKKVAITGDVAPDDDDPDTNPTKTFGMFGTPVLNKKGQVAFWASLTNMSDGEDGGEGLFVYDNGTLRMVTMKDRTTPLNTGVDNPQFTLFAAPSLNDNTDVAFVGFYTSQGQTSHGVFLYSPNTSGEYNSTGSASETIATTGMTTITSWGSSVSFVDFPSLSNTSGDRLVFWINSSGGTMGLVKNNGTLNTVLASSGSVANADINDNNDRLVINSFGASGTLSKLDVPSYNDAGLLAFWGDTTTTSGLAIRFSNATYNAIMVSGTQFMIDTTGGYVLSDGTNTHTFSGTFSAPVLNNMKAVAFWGSLTVNSEGLFLDEDSGADFILDTVNKGSRSQVIAPRRVRQGTTITVTVKIKNVGTSSVDPPGVIRAEFYNSTKTAQVGTEFTEVTSSADLDKGKSRVVKLRLKAPSTSSPQDVYVKVWADYGSGTGGTEELSETNNEGYSAKIQLR